jgi:hypothetical protein
MYLGWDPRDTQVSFNQRILLFYEPFQIPPPTVTIGTILKSEGADVNDRRVLKPFQVVAAKVPVVMDANRPILFRLRSKLKLCSEVVQKFQKLLGMKEPLWQSGWINTSPASTFKMNMVTEPLSADVWPDVVELEVVDTDHSELLGVVDYTLTARGYLGFAGCKLRFERTFPFFLRANQEFKDVTKAGFINAVFHRNSFIPTIKVSDCRPFPTHEKHDTTGANAELFMRLFTPSGVPIM